MFLKRLSYLLIFLLALSSCKTEKSKLAPYGKVFESVMRTDTGIFRGFDLGYKMDSVMAHEAGQPAEVDDGYLYYEYHMKDSSGTFSITYDFDESGLNEIQSDIFLKDPGQTDSVFASFKKYFDDHYGPEEDHMGFSVWTVKSDSYGNVRINLSDESSDLTTPGSPGKLSLWIYPDKEE
jgi:hypothetical protein